MSPDRASDPDLLARISGCEFCGEILSWRRRVFLRKDSADGIEGLIPGFFAREMEEVDYGAVEFTETKIVATNILRRLRPGRGDNGLKTCVSLLHGMNAIGADEVQTESGVDHGADNEWLDFPTIVFQDSICALPSPFKGPVGVRFPEIDP